MPPDSKPTPDNDLRSVMQTPEGRRVLTKILDMTGLRDDAFDPDRPHLTSYMEGRRSVGVQIERDMIGVDPHAYAVLVSENLSASIQSAVDQQKEESNASQS